jgi:hypothetical protein
MIPCFNRIAMVLSGILAMVPLLAGAGEARPAAAPRPYLLHLNGIGGERIVDHWLIEGLKEGGVDAQVELYDGTGGQVGIEALQGRDRHQREAKKIADKLVEQFRKIPATPIIITSHSGGCGLAVWALEQLPPDVKIDSLYMFSPALSPDYDLTRALAHVKGKLHVFSSPLDVVVLSTGTKLFGTIDGQRVEAAGLKGFVMPASAEENQYKKLVPHPFQRGWTIRYWNDGSHIGCLRPMFARDYVAPIFLTGSPPKDDALVPAAAPATRPATPRTAALAPAAPASGAIPAMP